MNNPYEVLEINESATDQQVEQAYINLQKNTTPTTTKKAP